MASSLAIFTVTIQLAKELVNFAIVGRAGNPDGAISAARYACAKVGVIDAQVENCAEHTILGKESVVGAPQEILIVDVELDSHIETGDGEEEKKKKKDRVKETRFLVVTAKSFSAQEDTRATCLVKALLPHRGTKVIRMRRVPWLVATNVVMKTTGTEALRRIHAEVKAKS